VYAFLRRHLPPVAAGVLTAIWYAALLAVVYRLFLGPQAEFRYLNL
jgi:hypothetical protein